MSDKQGNGKVVIIVGAKGYGKSSYLKKNFLTVSKKEKLCYALMKQDLGNYKYEGDFRRYVEIGVTKKDTLFVIDEAKTAIPKKEPTPADDEWDKKFVTWFLNSRKCNNMIFIVFHGWREIPLWLLMYIDYVVRFDTKDQLNVQKTRFSSFDDIVESFNVNKTIPKYQYDEIKIR